MDKIYFENIEYFYGLILIPVLIFLYLYYKTWTKRAEKNFCDSHLFEGLTPDKSKNKPLIKQILFLLGFFFLILALVNPQIGSKLQVLKRKGVDMVVAIDVSKSMLAEDVQPNRLTKSKLMVSKLIDELRTDRIGLIVYAGKAYPQLPITTDYAAAKMFLKTIDTDIVPTQGTAIGEAINMAQDYLEYGESKNQMLYIISDGEDHEEGVDDAIAEAVKNGIKISTVGIGLTKGGPIPVKKGSRTDFKKDNEGNVVVTKLNDKLLKEIAVKGGGSYIELNNIQGAVDFIMKSVSNAEKSEFESKRYADYEDQFQWFLGLAFFFFIIECLIPDSKTKWIRKYDIF
jgi:Ca-activated chloride channel family protein